jgi:ribosomal-protein-serine acetyltransferase
MEKPDLIIHVDNQTELRLLREDDAEALFALVDTNREYLRHWLPWLDSTVAVEDELAYIRLARENYQEDQGISCAIHYQGQLVGTIGFHTIKWLHRFAEIGYMLGEQFQGKGIMTNACRALIVYGFAELGLNKVVIQCATGNTRSCAIPQRLGFTREGVHRQEGWQYDHYVDLVYYGLLASEWRQTLL